MNGSTGCHGPRGLPRRARTSCTRLAACEHEPAPQRKSFAKRCVFRKPSARGVCTRAVSPCPTVPPTASPTVGGGAGARSTRIGCRERGGRDRGGRGGGAGHRVRDEGGAAAARPRGAGPGGETCPLSTGGGTRRVQLVWQGGVGGGGGLPYCAPYRVPYRRGRRGAAQPLSRASRATSGANGSAGFVHAGVPAMGGRGCHPEAGPSRDTGRGGGMRRGGGGPMVARLRKRQLQPASCHPLHAP